MVGGMIKLLYPDGVFTKEQLEEILKFALEMRRRVKEQLKKLGGMEFYDVNFSYIDNDTLRNISSLSRNRAAENSSPKECAIPVRSIRFLRERAA